MRIADCDNAILQFTKQRDEFNSKIVHEKIMKQHCEKERDMAIEE
jgi:hypothetical protein